MIVPRSVSLALAVVLTAGVPASASQRQVTGRVEIPTFGSPALPRTLYGATQSNGLVGWVLRVTPGRSFTLSTQAAPMGVEDFDIAFYASLDSSAPLAFHAGPGREAGQVPAGAAWGVITLSAGAGVTFSYSET